MEGAECRLRGVENGRDTSRLASSGADLEAKLRKLKELHEQGLLPSPSYESAVEATKPYAK